MNGVLGCEHVMAIFTEEKLCMLLLRKLSIIKEMVESLKIKHEATVLSQKADFSLTEFYKCWIITKLKLQTCINQSSKTNLNANLLKSMLKREDKLLDNSLMKCAMLLDPRFCDEIEGNQLIQTKEMLADIWKSMKPTRNVQENEPNTSENNGMASSADIFQSYMRNKGKQRQTILQNATTNDDILRSVDLFIEQEGSAEQSIDDDLSILKFWETKKKGYPILYEIAMVIFGIAPTEVTVERMFSVFGYIFNDYRSGLSQRLLEDMLIICLNPELFDEVNAENTNYLMTTKLDP